MRYVALLALIPVTVLPAPPFGAPAHEPKPGPVRFQIVASVPLEPGRLTPYSSPRGLRIEGPDGLTQHIVVSPGRYRLDFRNFARAKAGSLLYQQVLWAKEDGGRLYVETAHLTYARDSNDRNAYLSAIDVKSKRLLWRSPALVANASNFVLAGDVIVSGYGFTAELDYLYAIDRADGHVVARVPLPSAPERIVRHGRTLVVDTYDHRVTVRLVGA